MRRAWLVFTLVVAVFLTVPRTPAHEPDGHFAIDYQWLASPVKGGARPLRITATAIVPLEDVRVTGKIPAATSVNAREMRWGGAPAAGRAWPQHGVALGTVAAGQTFVFELEVIEPEQGGGILSISLDAVSGNRPVHEGIGIPVGLPGVAPQMRHGAWEFPAERGDPQP